MKQNPVVLIVTSKFGDGHLKVAEAIEIAFKNRGIRRIHTIDMLAEVYPRVNELFRRFYLSGSVLSQEIYGWVYSLTSRMNPGHPLGSWVHSMGKRQVQEILDKIRPDIIIHTFPYLAAAQLIKETGRPVPTFTILTDYVLHGRWLHPHTTKYFLAAESVKPAFLDAGISEEALMVSGIPIRPDFEQLQDREDLFDKYGLSINRRYLLLAAGAYGVLSNISGLIQSVVDKSDFDVIVVCGNNHKLRTATDDLFQKNNRVHVLGYTDKMHEWMSIASYLLTKAGGITLTEAIAQSLPVLVYRPLPGQEAGNAESLASQGIIDVVNNEDQFIHQLQQLEQRSYREEKQQLMKSFSRKSSAELIVSEVLQVTEARQPVARHAKPRITEGQATTIHGL
ncbi:glycosyltransferase [Paenibacillus sp. GCM10012306]|uniref:MGDG synthase family glycosyltransferase n=1 Tax=Paenibacillus sp. GCM10012306 TaxID=3317342 RepID=UPI00361997F9